MSVMERADPPIDPTTAWENTAARLRGEPGVSFRVRRCVTPDAAKSIAYWIRKGKLKAFRPAGHYHAESSGCDVYATYNGPTTTTETS